MQILLYKTKRRASYFVDAKVEGQERSFGLHEFCLPIVRRIRVQMAGKRSYTTHIFLRQLLFRIYVRFLYVTIFNDIYSL